MFFVSTCVILAYTRCLYNIISFNHFISLNYIRINSYDL